MLLRLLYLITLRLFGPRIEFWHGTGTGGVFESYHGAGKLAVWTSSGAPDRTGCGLAVDERGAEYISGVEKGNHVCGRTAEGRVVRIDITGVSDSLFGGVTGDVTVWGK